MYFYNQNAGVYYTLANGVANMAFQEETTFQVYSSPPMFCNHFLLNDSSGVALPRVCAAYPWPGPVVTKRKNKKS